MYIGAFSAGSFEIEDSFGWLEKAVRYFNYKYTEQETRVIDYGDASASEAMYRLTAEIIAGKMPDMLITHGLPVDRYISLDLLYDMSDWLNAEDFFAGPLEAMKTDGKLYEISPAITVTSFYGLEKYLGAEGALSLDDIYAAWEKFSNGGSDSDKAFISGLSNEIVCMLLVSAYVDRFIDSNTATCDFTSPEFIKLLEFCQKLPAHPPELNVKEDIGIYDPISKSTTEMPELHHAADVRRENALLGVMSTSKTWGIPYGPHYLVKSALGNADYRFIGYPGANTASVFLDFPIAVSANSANLETARSFVDDSLLLIFMNRGGDELPVLPFSHKLITQFVERSIKKTVATEEKIEELKAAGEYERYNDSRGLSMFNNNVLFTLFDNPVPYYTLDDYREVETIIDEAGIRVRSPIASYLPPFNKSQINPNRKAIVPSAASLLNPIIAEEIQALFGGIQDANRTAELIQSRYSVYLSEQKVN
jgi:hypothetical protein